ncbi:ComEC/Rec2 family competence protein [Moraxella nasovis]|uniref:ComEC/Rec2 family competence protein n=1 Tax=Moraxella nasovis TaxID=2904121 RepID=UPI001F61BE74|nr:ComEC/Rec2 family competence protein [Moraxella nasovis]UNU72994.1 ComEC/Rec2 family competence protein [Moraxella nasovis]
MTIWVFAGVVIALCLGLLSITPNLPPSLLNSAFLLDDRLFIWLSLSCFVLCILHAVFSRRHADGVAKPNRHLWVDRFFLKLGINRLIMFGLLGLMACLFIIRVLSTHAVFEQSVPRQAQTVRATATILEISDGVYDELTGSSYRQVAQLSDISLVHNAHHHAVSDHADNPFWQDGSADRLDDTPLTGTMTVLLRQDVRFGKAIKLPPLPPNTKIDLTLLIEPPNKKANADGFSGYRWLYTRHIHANAKIVAVHGKPRSADDGSFIVKLQSLRWELREHFYQNWYQYDIKIAQAQAVVLSLLTGDRALINRDTKDLYQFAGISHLLAISGTHVMFLALILAGFLATMVNQLYPRAYQYIPRRQLRAWVMTVAAFVYAWFTGFDVPAVRTVYMLLAVVVVQQLALPISAASVLVIVALAMIWLDPSVLWQAGFWLSFIAVLILMRYESQLTALDLDKLPLSRRIFIRFIMLCQMQMWLFIAMLPLSLVLFGKVSLWGLFVNLWAVSLFGIVIVPINLLAGVLFMFLPHLADWLWQISTYLLYRVHYALELIRFGDGGAIWVHSFFGGLGLLLLLLALGIWLMPKILPKSLVVLPLLIFTFTVINGSEKPRSSGVSVIVLASDMAGAKQILIQDAKRTTNWLILASYDDKPLTKVHTDTLIHQLKRHSVSSLAGIIVQTPSDHLVQTVAQIKGVIPVGEYWQAGHTKRQLVNLATQSCHENKSWQGDDFSIKAITGWPQIIDSQVWDCTIQINAPKLHLTGGIGMDDDSDITSVIINAATTEKLWQLWLWICQDLTTDLSQNTMWLSHIQAQSDSQVMDRFGVHHLKIIAKPTAQNISTAQRQIQQWQQMQTAKD